MANNKTPTCSDVSTRMIELAGKMSHLTMGGDMVDGWMQQVLELAGEVGELEREIEGEVVLGMLRKVIDWLVPNVETCADVPQFLHLWRESDRTLADAPDAKAHPFVPANVRPTVWVFAHAMERVLQGHDEAKGGQQQWRTGTLRGKLELLDRELDELRELFAGGSAVGVNSARDLLERIAAEAIDVANFAMMIYDQAVGVAVDPEVGS